MTSRVTVIVTIALLTVAAWAYLLRLEREMASGMEYAQDMLDMGMPMGEPWTIADFGFATVMWTVMMVGMMAPSAAPMLIVMAKSATARGDSGAIPMLFGLGYFVVWGYFSIAAALAQWWLHEEALLSPMMSTASVRAGGALLIVAGLYQLTPLKKTCLVHCRSPLDFLMTHWRSGLGGAFRMGLQHGAHCLGCCWALMVVLFAVGIMNLVWVAAISVLVLIERTGPRGVLLSRIAGVALVIVGLSWIVRV